MQAAVFAAAVALAQTAGEAGPFLVPLVAIDPGHGGGADGARGVCGEVEKDVTLDIALELGRLLEATGRLRVLLIRRDDADVDLEERAALANDAGADLLVSIHANSSPRPGSHGIEVFFLSSGAASGRLRGLVERENEGRWLDLDGHASPLDTIVRRLHLNAAHDESQRLAVRIHDRLTEDLQRARRGVLQAPFVVLRGARMPSVLVEVGFLSNPAECQDLSTLEHRQAVGRSLARAVLGHVDDEDAALARHGVPASQLVDARSSR